MNTNELLHITKNLQRQALDAYAYRQIIRQYHANLKEYSVIKPMLSEDLK